MSEFDEECAEMQELADRLRSFADRAQIPNNRMLNEMRALAARLCVLASVPLAPTPGGQ